MTKDLSVAFSHPDARAQAEPLGTALPPDRISLRDYVVEVEIGAFQAERGTTQRVRFNVVVEVRTTPEPLADDVDRILSYDLITDAIAAELTEERLNLLETLAERVADRILIDPKAARVFVRIEKLDRLPGALGVEIVRDGQPVRSVEAPQTAPRVVYVPYDVIGSDRLGPLLDRVEGADPPAILCVGPPNVPPPASPAPLAQRRIDLLALEQAAWVLAGRDARCVVVDSRTELEWAIKNGQLTVWAPSKIVLDALDGPTGAPGDGLGLAAWFAAHIEAADLCVLGDAPLPPADVPVQRWNVP